MGERTPPSRVWVGGGIAAVLLLMLLARRLSIGSAPADPQAARTEIERIADALDRFRDEHGAYPTTAQGLEALRGPYLPSGVPDDPWGRPYIYRSPGRADPIGFDLYTLGRDGAPGGEGEDGDVYAFKVRPVHVPRGKVQ